MEPIETIPLKDGKTLKIFQDEDPESPRTWDNLGKMICFHKKYNLGDKHDYRTTDFDSWAELKRAIRIKELPIVILPLIMYDHSGISLSTTATWPYDDKWDAGQVGFIYTTNESYKKMMGTPYDEEKDKTRVIDALLDEVNTYNKYLSGEVYGFQVVKTTKCDKCGAENEEMLDSCWGFYDIDEIKNEHKADMLDTEELLGDSDGGQEQEAEQEA